MLNLFSLNIKKIRTSYTKRTITSNSISLVFTNDILIIFISPLNFWNLTKKNGGNNKYLPFLYYVNVPKIKRSNKCN